MNRFASAVRTLTGVLLEPFGGGRLAERRWSSVERWDANRTVENAKRASFPVYGLASPWPIPGYLADARAAPDGSTDQLTTSLVTLAYGNPDARDPAVSVTTAIRIRPMAHSTWLDRVWITDQAAEASTAPDAPLHLSQASSEQRLVRLDGAPSPFTFFSLGSEHWAAEGRVGELAITVEAWRYPTSELDLIRIVDLDPYSAALLEGSWRAPPPA